MKTNEELAYLQMIKPRKYELIYFMLDDNLVLGYK